MLEGHLLDIIRKDLLSEEAMDLFLSEFTEDLQERQSKNRPEQPRRAYETCFGGGF
jgi:hypothetical protein